ncbi:MAG: hypothetical protein IT564_06340 [Rhodospirillales bacterium]|nr:hypothetical protein [Rhodospirillales bacterium]
MSPPVFVVHDLGQAKAALKAARERGLRVSLVSAQGAAAALGPAVWREMVAEAARAEPGALEDAILDCGRDPGIALAALREGVRAIAADVPSEVFAKIVDIAGQSGAAVATPLPSPARDLGDSPDPLAAARDWLKDTAP